MASHNLRLDQCSTGQETTFFLSKAFKKSWSGKNLTWNEIREMLALGQKWWRFFGYCQVNTWHLHLLIIKPFMICRKGSSGRSWVWHHDSDLEHKFCAWGGTTSHRVVWSELINRETWKKNFDSMPPRQARDTHPKWGGDFCLGVSLP